MPVHPVIPRDVVHALSEACADAPAVEAQARRALDRQPRLLRFFKANLPQMSGQAGEVSLYLLSVIVRIFEGAGGQLGRVGAAEIEAATRRIGGHRGLLPGDAGFPDRVRAVPGQPQPNVLDEALWALFEREKNLEKEVDIPPDQSALLFLLLWAATDALDAAWHPPAAPSWLQDAGAAAATGGAPQ